MKTLLLATRNPGKISELKSMLSSSSFAIKTLIDYPDCEEIQETGKTFKENAELKARAIGEKYLVLTLADDSGLEVDALSLSPGVHSARYVQGTDDDRIMKILSELSDIPEEKRTARFIAVIAIYDPGKKKVYYSKGVSEGIITEKKIGENGFGYDPIFYNLALGKTNAQATLDEKNSVSHRFQAIKRARVTLRKLT